MSDISKNYKYLGKSRPIIEGLEKITGKAKYASDFILPEMLHARILLSPYAHAKINNINISEAQKMPGVVSVLTAEDLPTKNQIMASRNSALLAIGKVLFYGQPVVAIVAKDQLSAEDALEKIKVDYSQLESITELNNAMKDESPYVWPKGIPTEESELVEAHSTVKNSENGVSNNLKNVFAHEHFERGDIQLGFKNAYCIVENHYVLPRVHQSYLEPHAVVAEPDILKGSIKIYTGTQGQFIVRNEVARILSLQKNKVEIIPMNMGGGFGAKYGIYDALTAVLAIVLKQPVRLVLTRSEDFQSTTPSANSKIYLKTGALKNGYITALQAKIEIDNGIFAMPFSGIMASLIGGYYKCKNTCIDCYEINTHKPQIGAYRAPGAPQITFALESNIDEMAEKLDKDPLEFRYQNAVESGDPMGNNAPWPEGIGLKKCIKKMKQYTRKIISKKNIHEGIGFAIGGWPGFMGPSSVICGIESDGIVRLHLGSIDISGVNSSFVLIAAEELSVSPDQIEIINGNTLTGPYAPNSGGSQITYSLAGAVSEAAKKVKEKLLYIASNYFEVCYDDLQIDCGKVWVKGVPHKNISFAKLALEAQTMQGGPGPILEQASSSIEKNSPCFTIHMARVSVDYDSGNILLLQYISVHDVGFALNPVLVEGQIHGGSVQGIGMGMFESLNYEETGQLLSNSFMEYTIPRADDIVNIETILVENHSPTGPYGVRGIGEPPIIPGGAAIANAIKNATGLRFSKLPIKSETIWKELKKLNIKNKNKI